MNCIIHLNDKVRSAGGVEVYLSQLQPLLNKSGLFSYWFGLQREGNYIRVVNSESPEKEFCVELKNLKTAIRDFCQTQQIIYHVHSISDPTLLKVLFSDAPVVRTMHEPRIFCPGQGKFWRTDEIPCISSCGMHCIWHTYQKRCSNRHPKRLLPALHNTYYELTTATKKYASVIANSQWIANQAIEAGVPKNKIQVIPYFTEDTQPTTIPKTDNPKILFVGRLTKEKGLHYLIDALVAMQKLGMNPHLNIVGDGHERSIFENQVEQLGLQKNCTFYGWLNRSQINEMFHQCMVVVFPSIYPEAFGIVGIEAMIRARPVIAFDIGGVQEWLQDGLNGLLVKSKDSDGLAVALTKVCKNYEYASQLGNAGYKIALKKFLPRYHINKLTQLYRKILY